MIRTLRSLIAPAYLLACIAFGGSAQSLWGAAAIAVFGLAILAWAAVDVKLDEAAGTFRIPALLIVAGLVVVLLQLVPVPPAIWSALPGRSGIAAGFTLLHWPLPWLPVSEEPFDSTAAVFGLIPPLAMVAAIHFGGRDRRLAYAMVVATALSILLSAVQVAGGPESPSYLYPMTSGGAVGFFANGNHMATLLLASIPFAAVLPLTRSGDSSSAGEVAMGYFLATVAIVVILVGILLNGSLAAFLLIGPVLLASSLLLPIGWRFRRIAAPIALLGILAALVALTLRPVQSGTAHQAEVSLSSRDTIWRTTVRAIADNSPLGTGLGTFETVYPQYEDPHSVTSVYVNHAHNDYLELALELGWAGIALVLLFIAWWARLVLRVWTSNASSPVAKAATVASATVVAHSAVDFPLRTAAIAAVFGMCIGLMIHGVTARTSRSSRRARHVTIG